MDAARSLPAPESNGVTPWQDPDEVEDLFEYGVAFSN
jgi:hypothetical protein